MKARSWRILAILLAFTLILAGCGGKDDPKPSGNNGGSGADGASEAYFEWDENFITGLTEKGRTQKTIVVPARCEGFTDAVFANCSVEEVRFEDDDDLEISVAFMGSNVRSVVLPAGVTKIPMMAFQMCESLETVKLPEKLTELGTYAFSGCASLTAVEFTGDQLTVISGNSFENCASLKEIRIPNGVEKIEKYAFFGCKSLAKVELPGTLKTVEGNAFGNTALTEVHLPEQITDLKLDGIAFGENTFTMTVFVKSGSWLDQNRDSWDIGFGKITAE